MLPSIASLNTSLGAATAKPWRHSTGPKTPEGKARSGLNGRHLQVQPISKADIERKVAEVNQLLKGMAACRALVSGGA
jgi:hypothetical protein